MIEEIMQYYYNCHLDCLRRASFYGENQRRPRLSPAGRVRCLPAARAVSEPGAEIAGRKRARRQWWSATPRHNCCFVTRLTTWFQHSVMPTGCSYRQGGTSGPNWRRREMNQGSNLITIYIRNFPWVNIAVKSI
jgi:hypothetical protein